MGGEANMVKKETKPTATKTTKTVKGTKKEIQDAARKKLMDLKEC
jgi:hypothetical protein